MKLLYVVHQFLPRHAAGTEIYTYHLAKEVQRRGHEVSLYFTECYTGRPQYDLRRGEFDGLPFYEVVHNYHFASFKKSYVDPQMEERFVQILDEVKPDLIHFQHLHLHSIGYLDIGKERGLPMVYTLHEFILMCLRGGQLLRPDFIICDRPVPEECANCAVMYPPPDQKERPPKGRAELMVKSWLPKGLRKLMAHLRGRAASRRGAPAVVALNSEDSEDSEDSANPYVDAVTERLSEISRRLLKVDLFISPSAFLRDRYIDVGMIMPDKIIVSDNGFNVAAFKEARRTESAELRVGFIGTIAEYKGIHLIVEAFEGIDDPMISCRIYGNLDTFPDYKEKLLGMTRSPQLEFMGRFDNSKIGEVLAGIDVLVVPSVWFENSPLTIHEAFLAKVPVLTADRGGMRELVKEGVNGLHFRLGDASDLRAKILRLRNEKGLLDQLRGAFPHVKTIQEDAELMEARYAQLLRGERPLE